MQGAWGSILVRKLRLNLPHNIARKKIKVRLPSLQNSGQQKVNANERNQPYPIREKNVVSAKRQ